MTTKPVSAIILAAGNSGRMGSDKALLPYGNGLSFSGHLIKGYRGFGSQPVVMVVNKNLDLSGLSTSQFVAVLNEHLDWGRSYSILLGIKKVPKDCSCFLHNIDNPFIEHELLAGLMDAVEPGSYVVPVSNGRGGHPVLLGKLVVDHLRDLADLPDFRDVLKQFKRIEVTYEDERILLNINTPAEYYRFLKISQD